jgi:hypothetical protein
VTAAMESGGVWVKLEGEIDCTHDVDDDTPVEEGTIICKKRVGFEAAGGGQKIGTTAVVTTTGRPIAIGTITNAANLTLPTGAPGSANRARVGWGAMVASVTAIFLLQFVLC